MAESRDDKKLREPESMVASVPTRCADLHGYTGAQLDRDYFSFSGYAKVSLAS